MDYVDNPYDATKDSVAWKAWEIGACDALLGCKMKHGQRTVTRVPYIKGYIMMTLHIALVRQRTIEVIA